MFARSGAVERGDAVAVGADGDDGRAVRRVARRRRSAPAGSCPAPETSTTSLASMAATTNPVAARIGSRDMRQNVMRCQTRRPSRGIRRPGHRSAAAPRPQLPPAAPALQQRAWAALALAVLSLIAMMLIGNLQRARLRGRGRAGRRR